MEDFETVYERLCKWFFASGKLDYPGWKEDLAIVLDYVQYALDEEYERAE